MLVSEHSLFACSEVGPRLLDYIDRQCRGAGTPVLVAHNGRRFDLPFLSNELKRSNLELPAHYAFLDTLIFCKVRCATTCAPGLSSLVCNEYEKRAPVAYLAMASTESNSPLPPLD